MLGGMAAKWRWRAKRQAEGKPTDKPNMVCGAVQVVWHKFAKYWDIEMREVPMSPGSYAMTPEDVLERVDENTIMVVPTLGLTYTGVYEMVQPIVEALDGLQAETGLDIDIHVDAASGGFLAPFCAPDLVWDFRLPRVKSISASGHKFGLAPLGVGWVVWSDRAELPDDLIFHVNYLGGDMPVFQINFSRPAGQIVAEYYDFLRLGREGYRRVHSAAYATGKFLAAEIAALGQFEMLHDSDPSRGIPCVTWRIPEGSDPGFTLFDLADRLRVRGWQVPAYTLTGGCLRRRGPADPGTPGRQPGSRHSAPRRLPRRPGPPRAPPGCSFDDSRGVLRVQSPLTAWVRTVPAHAGGILAKPTGGSPCASASGRCVSCSVRRPATWQWSGQSPTGSPTS